MQLRRPRRNIKKNIEKFGKRFLPFFSLQGLGHVTSKSPLISGLGGKFEKRYGHVK